MSQKTECHTGAGSGESDRALHVVGDIASGPSPRHRVPRIGKEGGMSHRHYKIDTIGYPLKDEKRSIIKRTA